MVEYVPQYDEEINPVEFSQGTRLTPTPTAIPAEPFGPVEGPALSVEEARAAYHEDDILDEGAAPSVADAEGPNLADVAEESVEAKPVESDHRGAASSAPKGDSHPLDDVPLADLADGEPPKEDALRKEAESPEHMLTHFPKNPFCRICNIAKNTSRKVAHKPDAKDDDYVDPPKEVFEQLATDDVILAKGSEHMGVGIGGIRSHYMLSEMSNLVLDLHIPYQNEMHHHMLVISVTLLVSKQTVINR